TVNKKLCLSTAVLTLLSPFAAFADDPTGPTVWDGFSGWLSPDWSRDFSATAGVKVWVNEWSRDLFLSQTATLSDGTVLTIVDTGPDSQESDIEAVPIPQLSARYKWLFVTGSYYSKTEFDFEPTFGQIQLSDSSGNITDSLSTRFEVSGERYEWDASGGIYVHPYVAILGGYKKVSQTLDQTVTSTLGDEPPAVTLGFNTIDIEGPTIGIAGSVPIGRGFGMYASYAHGFMNVEARTVVTSPCCSDDGDQDVEFDADYDVAEAGFSYTHGMDRLMPHLPLSAATVYAGYRYQVISTDLQDLGNQDRSDVTKGFAVGLNLTF
ncbi:MAG: hypothetical protein ACREA0_07810, partial [bacterium]